VDGQLELEISASSADPDPEVRTYWEHRGPHDWRPVTVRVRYGRVAGLAEPVLPLVRTARMAPRNVLVEREDGTAVVKPVRLLRCKPPR
jgi:hypothetical protein